MKISAVVNNGPDGHRVQVHTDTASQALAIPAGKDPMSVQEAQWQWHGDLFSHHPPYVAGLVDGLRRAGVPEGPRARGRSPRLAGPARPARSRRRTR